MTTYTVTITKEIEVTIDETKFDDAFMKEFREDFYNFDTVEEHIEHLAQLKARGFIDDFSFNPKGIFIEGYGYAQEMGIDLKITDENWEVEIDK